jgi:single-strand DNA-binding protein
MLNQIVLVGRLVGDVEVKELESGKRVANAVLAVPRNFKNENGEYDTDFIDVVIWNSIADNTAEYCKKGDIVGIKGRLETNNYETENGEIRKLTQVIAEKVTFLSSSKREED